MSAELVGPLQALHYNAVTGYADLPKNTIDLRYDACADHHPACACREAMLSEVIGEYRSELRNLERLIIAATAGHHVWDVDRPWGPNSRACKCPMCQLRRTAAIGYFEWREEQRRTERLAASRGYTLTDPDIEVPF